MPEAMEILTPYDFYYPETRLIYETLLKMTKENKPIDTVLLITALGDRVAECGGVANISALPDFVPSSRNIKAYAEIVKGLSEKRYIMDGVTEIQGLIKDGGEVGAGIDKMSKIIMDITNKDLSQIQSAEDLTIKAFDELQTGSTYGIPTGYRAIDYATRGLQPGWLCVIAADSSEGKTTFALNIALNQAKMNHASLFITCEMTAIELMKKHISAECEVDESITLDDPMSSDDYRNAVVTKRTSAASITSTLPIYFDDKKQSVALISVRVKAFKKKLEMEKKKLSVVFVDYLQRIKPEDIRQAREQQIASISRDLKSLAMETLTPIVVMSQVNKERKQELTPAQKAKNVKLRNYRGTDLRESQAIYHDADIVMFLNPDYPPELNDEERKKLEIVEYWIEADKHRGCKYFGFRSTFYKSYSKFTER
jgi:replicative DNA helicase